MAVGKVEADKKTFEVLPIENKMGIWNRDSVEIIFLTRNSQDNNLFGQGKSGNSLTK